MRVALITGVTGQDGFHLSSLLKTMNYQIIGTVTNLQSTRVRTFLTFNPDVELVEVDLTDSDSLSSLISDKLPDEIYNLAAESRVSQSFKEPLSTTEITGLAPLRILEVLRKLGLNKAKFYQASSSEMFGLASISPQNEKTAFHPRSPYASAKTFAHYTTQNYREAYGLYACSGILFNHEGQFRRHEFVTRKITSSLAKIKLGMIPRFNLGLLSQKRDWGYAGDYVEAMWLMMQLHEPEDFVIATGVARSIQEFLLYAMRILNLGDEIEKYVDFDPLLTRPTEIDNLVGDSTKAQNKLGWKPKTSFEHLVEIMVENDLRIESMKK